MHEISRAELRILKASGKNFKDQGSSIKISASGASFSEHIENKIGTNLLLSRFYIGRLSDLDLVGFDTLCRNARLPICPHWRTDDVLAKAFLRGMNPGDVRRCLYCRTSYFVTITINGMIELHISLYIGFPEKAYCPILINAIHGHVNSAFFDRCRAFSDWLDSMYNPETGAVYNGGQFKTFAPPRKSTYRFHKGKQSIESKSQNSGNRL